MRIIYIHRTQGDGVEGVHIREIIRALIADGHRVGVLAPGGWVVDGGAAIPAARGEETPNSRSRYARVLAWMSRRLPEVAFELAELVYNVVAMARLGMRANGRPVDMVFERYAIFSVVGLVFARLRGCPLVLEVNYTSKSPLVRRRSRWLKPLAAGLDRLLFRRAEGLVAVSTTLRDELVREYGVEPSRVIVLPNAADPGRFAPTGPATVRMHGWDISRHRVIGFVGGFYPWHGLPLLIAAFQRIAERFNDVMLVLVGDGPERVKIQRLIDEKELSRRVLLPGRVDHAELPDVIRAFHVGVMPDSNDYGSPMKIFEYMAAAKPVVVPDRAPLLDVVTDGVEGRVFRAGDACSLATALVGILENPECHRTMGEAGRSRICQDNNWQANARAILALAEKTAVSSPTLGTSANPRRTETR